MKKIRIEFIFLCLIAASGCTGISGLTNTGGSTNPMETSAPYAASPTALPTVLATPPATAAPIIATVTQTSSVTAIPAPNTVPTATITSAISACGLVNSQDLAHLFPQNRLEMQTPKEQQSRVVQPAFSSINAPGTEYSCTLFGFINPDVHTMQLIQITYTVDIPDPASIAAWDQAWTQLKTSGNAVPNIGEGAYYNNGKLTYKQGSMYITVEVIGQALGVITPTPGSSAERDVEMRIAQLIYAYLK